jgi:mannose-6-phosphate isomerase-like protein (cupin superfamily)
MLMEHTRIENINSWMGPATGKRSLSKALGAEHVSLNQYILEPGESFAFGYHRHAEQEEIFYMIEGTATFETESGDVAVGAGEAVRFEPGEWQQGRNTGDKPAVAIAIGAPQEAGETTILRECETCGSRTKQEIKPTDDQAALVTLCLECGVETGRFE